MDDAENLRGRRFGKLVVMNRRTAYGLPFEEQSWDCECDCGRSFRTTTKRLIGGKTTSCGCSTKRFDPDLIGKRFGKLTVESLAGATKRSIKIWHCVCDCGGTIDLQGYRLRQGCERSCGCEPHVVNPTVLLSREKRFHGQMPLFLFNAIRRKAIQRGLAFEIDVAYIWELFEEQGGKCALSGVPLEFLKPGQTGLAKDMTASLDRIDSTIGYVVGNVQWVHKNVNFMKQSFTDEYFMEMCRAVTMHQARRYVL